MHTSAFRIPDRPTRWLLTGLGLTLLAAVVPMAVLMLLRGESPGVAFEATAPSFSSHLLRASRSADSWEPMMLAYEGFTQQPPRSLYAPFFEQGIKFQYPPSSLLPFQLLPQEWLVLESGPSALGVVPGASFRSAVGRSSQVAVWVSIALSLLVFSQSIRRERLTSPRGWALALRVVLGVALAAMFYPLVKAHSLGQVQVYLNALVALAVFFELTGRRSMAGVCVGVCVLFKPQYGLVLVWALLRRRWPEAIGVAATVLLGTGAALLTFGWSPHVEYLEVLRRIGSLGESFWPNQSVNGVMNRFLYNGDLVQWTPYAYAPYLAVVHAATVVSSLLMVAAALVARPGSPVAASLDFLIVVLVSTMASPVAWEHHYGILLPIFAAATPVLLHRGIAGRWTGVWVAFCFVATASVLLRPDEFFVNRWAGLLASNLFFGALGLFVLLLFARHRVSTARP